MAAAIPMYRAHAVHLPSLPHCRDSLVRIHMQEHEFY